MEREQLTKEKRMNMIEQAKQLREQAKEKAASEGKDWTDALIRQQLYAELSDHTENPEGMTRVLLNWDRAARDANTEASDINGDDQVPAEPMGNNGTAKKPKATRQKTSERYSDEELRSRISRWTEQSNTYQDRLLKKTQAALAKRQLWEKRVQNADRKTRHYQRRLETLTAA